MSEKMNEKLEKISEQIESNLESNLWQCPFCFSKLCKTSIRIGKSGGKGFRRFACLACTFRGFVKDTKLDNILKSFSMLPLPGINNLVDLFSSGCFICGSEFVQRRKSKRWIGFFCKECFSSLFQKKEFPESVRRGRVKKVGR